MKLFFILVVALLLSDILQSSAAFWHYSNMAVMSDYALAAVLALLITPWVNTQFE